KHKIVYRIKRYTDSKICWVDCRGVRIIDKNGITKVVGTLQDITEQKELELKTLESEKSFRDIFDNAQSGLLYISGKRFVIKANQRAADIFGYISPEEMIGLNMRDFHLSQEQYIEFGKMNFNSLSMGVKNNIEYEARRKDGSGIWCEVSGKAIDDNIPADMSKGILWTISDISQRVELRKTQVFLKGRLSLAIEASNDGLWDWNIQTNDIYYSPRWKKILGYSDNEFKNEYKEWVSRIHQDDIKSVLMGFENFLASTNLNDKFNNNFRMRHKDGHWVSILSRGKKVFNEKNEVERIVGTHVDMTELYAVQDAYKQERDRSDLYLDTAEVLLLALDNNARVTMLNRKGEELLGYKEEELLGEVWFETGILPEDIALGVKDFFHGIISISELPIKELEHHLITKSGEKLMFSFRTSFLFDNDKKCIGILSSGIDITQKIIAEEELSKQHKYLQSIIDGVDDPIMVIKEDYTVEVMNESLKKSFTSLNIADREHPKCYEVSHNRKTPCDGINHPCPLREVLETNQHTSVVHTHNTNYGDNRHVELSASPLFDKNKNCIGIIEVARDITGHLNIQDELREQKNILHHQAHHDSLTGLPNRILFNDRLEQAIETAKRNKTSFALLFIDLDHFKEINDSLGHNFGDEVLITVSKKLKEVIRYEDTVARLGGDEFTIILKNLSKVEDASMIANKILETLSKAIIVDNNTLYASCSIGISIYPNDGLSAQSLLKFSDSAMYKAKEEGRNNFQYYNSTMTELAFERVVMEANLRAGLKNKEFIVYYQPQVNGATDKLIGMEALVRWQHPTMGLISPDKFIPLAESTGLIVELDRFVMKTAMTQLSLWYKAGFIPGILAMNLTQKQLKKDDFIEMLQNLLIETECKPEWLELEVTESQIMTNPYEAIKVLKQISDIGIELAVDDFGTGYSSLAYLKRLPIDKLKIDQEFIRNLPDDEEDSAIAKAVIVLAHSLNLKIIAEGVETKEQRDFIVESGCDNIQGYFYSRPIVAKELEVLLKKDLISY
ncbi:MAG: diguanylate cyclase (GGDEF)-like protein/PAS domain S-box-containing protein, partial [Sulfurimonas sp.]